MFSFWGFEVPSSFLTYKGMYIHTPAAIVYGGARALGFTVTDYSRA